MRRTIISLACLGSVLLGFSQKAFTGEIVWEDLSSGMQDFKSVVIHPENPQIIYAGLAGGIFKGEDRQEGFRPLLLIKGQSRKVNFLLFGHGDANSLYAATGNGLFYSHNQGRGWQRIFKGKNSFENECTAIAVSLNNIYLGTQEGLFISKDKGRFWHKAAGRLGKSPILAVACNLKDTGYIYAASSDGVFKTQDGGNSWERIFVAQAVTNGDNAQEENEERDEEERFSEARHIAIDPNNLNCLYLGTSGGVYRSQDKGASWQLLSAYGLLDRGVRFLLIGKDSQLYAATKSAVFEYKESRWQELTFNLTVKEIGLPALDSQGNLYLPCDNGLFRANPGRNEQANITALYYKDEPAINEVQQAAIQYAEVAPEKIKLWREKAAKKAFLPKVTVGINRDTSDLWHWESGSTTKTGDDILVRGRETLGWDVALSWDLGELVWNDDQTSIDVRSRLMVQLRDDVLDEVTKLYFERIRVKMELDNLSIEDRKKRFEKKLRLQELTAYLDGLTGGYFSSQIK